MIGILSFITVHVTSCSEIIFTNGNVSNKAYAGCESVTTVHIGPTTKRIGSQAFENANNLKLITSPPSIDDFTIDIEESAFKNIANDAVLFCANCVINSDVFDAENLTLISDVKEVDTNAFSKKINAREKITGVLHPNAFETDTLFLGDVSGNVTIAAHEIHIDSIICDDSASEVFLDFDQIHASDVTHYSDLHIHGEIKCETNFISPMNVHVWNVPCNRYLMGELFVNFKCYEGISSPMIGSHNDLHVYGGFVSKETVTGNWYSIFIGNRTSKGIDYVDPFQRSVNATTIYANSCPDQVININLAPNNTHAGLNITNGRVYPVRDICSPCESGFFFNLITSECQKCEKKCKRNEFAVINCTYTTELICDKCPIGTSTPDNTISLFCIPNSKKRERLEFVLILFSFYSTISVCVLAKLFYNFIRYTIKKQQ